MFICSGAFLQAVKECYKQVRVVSSQVVAERGSSVECCGILGLSFCYTLGFKAVAHTLVEPPVSQSFLFSGRQIISSNSFSYE